MLTYGLHVLYLLSYPPSVGADRRPGGPSVRAAAAAAEGPVAEALRRGIPAAHQMSFPAEAATAALPPPPPPPPPPKKRTVQSAAAARVAERLRRARQLDEEQATAGRTAMHPGDAAAAAAPSSTAPPTALGPKLWSLLRLGEPWRNESTRKRSERRAPSTTAVPSRRGAAALCADCARPSPTAARRTPS